jgi:hypothetical protein
MDKVGGWLMWFSPWRVRHWWGSWHGRWLFIALIFLCVVEIIVNRPRPGK